MLLYNELRSKTDWESLISDYGYSFGAGTSLISGDTINAAGAGAGGITEGGGTTSMTLSNSYSYSLQGDSFSQSYSVVCNGYTYIDATYNEVSNDASPAYGYSSCFTYLISGENTYTYSVADESDSDSHSESSTDYTFTTATSETDTSYATYNVTDNTTGFALPSATLNVTSSSTYSSYNVVTTSAEVTSTYFTITGNGGTSWTTTAYDTVDALTNTTAFALSTITYNTTSAVSVEGFVDYGTVVEAQGTDWLWSFWTDETSVAAPDYFTNFAVTFGTATFWPEYSTSEISFLDFGSADGTHTIDIPANSFSASIEVLTSDTFTTTLTTGSYFPRDTCTATTASWSVSGTTTVIGSDSSEFVGFSTSSYGTTTVGTTTDTIYTSFSYGDFGYQTTTLYGLREYFTTTEVTVGSAHGYVFEASTANATSDSLGSYEGWGDTTYSIASTSLYQVGQSMQPLPGGATYWRPVAPQAAFLPPQNLHSASNLSSYGSNYNLNGASVFYPFPLHEVCDYVAVPFPTDFANSGTTDTDGGTWKYSWTSDTAGMTLNFSSITSYLSGTHTVFSQDTSSAFFSTEGSIDGTYVAEYGAPFLGGFQPVSFNDSVFLGPRAVWGTSIDTAGGFTTYSLITTDTSSAEGQDTMVVEEPALVFYQFAVLDGGGYLPIAAYTRNPIPPPF